MSGKAWQQKRRAARHPQSGSRERERWMLLDNSSPLLVQFGIPAHEIVVPTFRICRGWGDGFPTVKSF